MIQVTQATYWPNSGAEKILSIPIRFDPEIVKINEKSTFSQKKPSLSGPWPLHSISVLHCDGDCMFSNSTHHTHPAAVNLQSSLLVLYCTIQAFKEGLCFVSSRVCWPWVGKQAAKNSLILYLWLHNHPVAVSRDLGPIHLLSRARKQPDVSNTFLWFTPQT